MAHHHPPCPPQRSAPCLDSGGHHRGPPHRRCLLIEVTFSWPGVALRLQQAISQRDYPVVQGVVAVVVAVTVVVDVLVAWIDPGVRF